MRAPHHRYTANDTTRLAKPRTGLWHHRLLLTRVNRRSRSPVSTSQITTPPGVPTKSSVPSADQPPRACHRIRHHKALQSLAECLAAHRLYIPQRCRAIPPSEATFVLSGDHTKPPPLPPRPCSVNNGSPSSSPENHCASRRSGGKFLPVGAKRQIHYPTLIMLCQTCTALSSTRFHTITYLPAIRRHKGQLLSIWRPSHSTRRKKITKNAS
jgi:hypothetical protein